MIATRTAFQGLVAVLMFGAAPAAEAMPAESWPCESEPKTSLAAADFWVSAGTAAARGWRADAMLAQLVADVSPRSVDVVDAGMRLYQFTEGPAAPELLRARLAAGLIETIDGERRSIIAGIRRFNLRQEQLARRIEQGYAALNAPGGDAAGQQRDAIDEQVKWDTRIFEDRQRMLPVICRQPAALETRMATLVAALRAPPGLPVVAAAADKYLVYVTNEGSGDVSIIDPGERREIGRIAIGKRPRGLVGSPDGSLLYVAVSGSPAAGPGIDESKLPPADKAADGIVVIDLVTRKVVRTLRGISDPEQIAISPDGAKLYVASEDSGRLFVLGRDGALLTTLNVGGEPEGVTVSADGATVLATSETDHTVAVIKGAPLKVAGLIQVGERPRNAVFLGSRRVIVPGEFDASLSVLDIVALKSLRTITLSKADRPMGVTRLGGNTILVTTGRGGRLVRVDVDAVDEPVTGAATVGPRPWGLALAPDATLAFTANGPSNDVSIVDTRSMAVIAKVTVGEGPWGVTVLPLSANRR